MRRYDTIVEDETVYIDTSDGRLEVGTVDRVIDVVGGHAWTIDYSEWDHTQYDDLDTSDQGLVVDVVDMMRAMTHSESFVETLRAHPAESPADTDGALSPRLGLFVGKLLENLENGLD
ncbi:hypothetical protein ACFR9U_16340 [Halorientalis brevis]|uniref:Uncharacterized protein n=1 Tax=Halorientalis brevis TaxID=1126241 RepID=A0ABD6CGL8_9EURY|nr:hypothetical protein [Halorientalis brevis]